MVSYSSALLWCIMMTSEHAALGHYAIFKGLGIQLLILNMHLAFIALRTTIEDVKNVALLRHAIYTYIMLVIHVLTFCESNLIIAT